MNRVLYWSIDRIGAAAPINSVRSHLVDLRMPRALETLEHLVQQPKCGQLSATEATEALVAEDIAVRESRWIKAAPAEHHLNRLSPCR